MTVTVKAMLVVMLAVLAAQGATPVASPTAYLSPTPTYFSPGSIVLTPSPLPDDSLEVLPDVVTARFIPSTYTPRTGEPFTLTLIVDLPPGFTLVEWPTFPDQWGDFMVRGVSDMTEEKRADGGTIHRQSLTVILWEPKDFTTPEAFIGYGDGFSVLRVPTRAAFINVPTVLLPGDENLRPLRPAIYLPYLSPWLVLLITGVMGGVFGLGYRRLKQRRQQPVEQPSEQPQPPGEIALQALTHLKQRAETVEITPQVGDILRDYIAARFATAARELTTDELILQLEGRLSERLLAELGRILQQIDLAKFAGASLDVETAQRFIDLASRWIAVAEREGQPRFDKGQVS